MKTVKFKRDLNEKLKKRMQDILEHPANYKDVLVIARQLKPEVGEDTISCNDNCDYIFDVLALLEYAKLIIMHDNIKDLL